MQSVRFVNVSTILLFFVFVISSSVSCSKKKTEELDGTLYLAEPLKIKGLDPAHASDRYSINEISRTYEGLLRYHYLKRPYELEPNLAEEMPKLSKDKKTYTFKLRKGIVFQDDACFKGTSGKGREVVARDFVYSFMRLADPKTRSEGWWIFDGRIKGLNEWRTEQQGKEAPNYDAGVEGLNAVDQYTLQLTLNKPSYQFLYFLAMPFSFVVPRECVEHYGKDFIRNPVGTGPYVLSRNESNLSSKLIWNKNPTYRKVLYPSKGEPDDEAKGLLRDAGKPLPLSEKIVVNVFVESQPMWLNFLAGKLDVSGIPKDNFDQAITPGKSLNPEFERKGIRLLQMADLDITHNSFNMLDPLLGKNKHLRQAMSLAYDPDPLIELFYNGRAMSAQGPIPPGLKGYDPGFKNPYRQYNIEKAKQLLAKAGYPNGKGLPEIEYLGVANSTSRQMAEYFQKSMAELGVKIRLSFFTWPQFLEKVKNRKGQMWGYAWGADYPDAENFLQLFYSKNISPGPNDSNYIDKEYDRLYEKSLTLPDGPERTSLYKQMVAKVVEDAPWIWGAHRLAFALVHKWVKNYKQTTFEHGRGKYLTVDPELKKMWKAKL